MPDIFGWVDEPIAIGVAVSLATLGSCMALFQIYDHLSHWTHPHLQKYITRILLLLPVYALNSSASLIAGDPRVSVYLDSIRDAYEGYVLYQFMALLIGLCGGDQELVRLLNEKGRFTEHHLFFQKPRKVDRQFVNFCRKCVLQYAFIKPILAVTTMACMAIGVYEENRYSLNTAYLYVVVVYNISVSISLYYLVMFGVELSPELVFFSPKSKFLCIKSVIFFAFWQSFLISMFGYFDLLGETDQQEKLGVKIQDFLICCELLGVAVLHHLAFSYTKMVNEVKDSPYLLTHLPQMDPDVAAKSKAEMLARLKTVLDVNDLVQDSHKAFVKGTKNSLLDSGYDDHNREESPHPTPRGNLQGNPLHPTEDLPSADSHLERTATPEVEGPPTGHSEEQRESALSDTSSDSDTDTHIDIHDSPKECYSRQTRRLSSLPYIFGRK